MKKIRLIIWLSLVVSIKLQAQQNFIKPTEESLPITQEGSTPSKQMLSMESSKEENMDHSHMPVAVPQGVATPELSIDMYPDAMGGYNLILQTQNYHLIPPPMSEINMMVLMAPSINKETGFVEGHAHLYVNGAKIQRVYGNAVYLPSQLFKSGINQITVSINNHGHMYWTSAEKQILATLFIFDDGKPTVKYKFESFPLTKIE